jgi:putative flippase GtrA
MELDGARVKEETPRDGKLYRLYQWIRYHISSLVATGVDFLTMIGAVELLHVSPVLGTVFGAAVGGVTNFLLGRHFTFRSQSRRVGGQALRYSLVSAASLGLNALGEHIFLSFALFASHYVLGRILVATTVNNVWNYPMQRFFVFAERKPDKEDPA